MDKKIRIIILGIISIYVIISFIIFCNNYISLCSKENEETLIKMCTELKRNDNIILLKTDKNSFNTSLYIIYNQKSSEEIKKLKVDGKVVNSINTNILAEVKKNDIAFSNFIISLFILLIYITYTIIQINNKYTKREIEEMNQ